MPAERFCPRSRVLIEEARARAKAYFGARLPPLFEPLRYIEVNPLEIQFRCGLSYPKEGAPLKGRLVNYGRVVEDRDWEVGVRPVRAYALARCLERRFLNGLSWEESGVIDLKLKEIQRAGRPIDGCRTREDLIQRYRRIDALFDDVLKAGFKRQVDIKSQANITNELFVSIGASGRIYFSNGGNHRLIISQIQRLASIPVLVMARDHAWVKRVLRCRSDAASPAFQHPDLSSAAAAADA